MPFGSPVELLITLPAILIALTFHEYAHGKIAALLGDPTPAAQGRLTLNPLAHLDLLGTLMLIFSGFGWAKPVQVNPFHFRMDRQRGMLLVALAGPVMNLILAYLVAVIANLRGQTYFLEYFFWRYLIGINISLAVFNLIPVPPLDGSKVLAGLLPRRSLGAMHQLESYGPLILILILLTGVAGRIILPVVKGVQGIIYTLSGLGF